MLKLYSLKKINPACVPFQCYTITYSMWEVRLVSSRHVIYQYVNICRSVAQQSTHTCCKVPMLMIATSFTWKLYSTCQKKPVALWKLAYPSENSLSPVKTIYWLVKQNIISFFGPFREDVWKIVCWKRLKCNILKSHYNLLNRWTFSDVSAKIIMLTSILPWLQFLLHSPLIPYYKRAISPQWSQVEDH